MAENDARLEESPPPLRFGLFDWIDNSGLELADLYEQRMRLLEYADEAGFYCYHLAEHQATPLSMAPSPSVFLAAAASAPIASGWGPWSTCCLFTIPCG